MCPVKSNNQLANKKDDLISLLQKFKLTTSKSNYAVTADISDSQTADFLNNPFSQYKQQILDSKSRIILL